MSLNAESQKSHIIGTSKHETIRLSELQEKQGIATLALLGSVASGKTSICKLLTGETTQKHSTELVNGCTVKMGYKNLKIYYNGHTLITNPRKVPDGYRLVRHFSIADNPGHNSFMATLVTGLNDIDCGLFLVSGANGIEPQTLQHMKCFKSTEIKNMAMIISKMDLVFTKNRLDSVVESIDNLMASEKLHEDIDPPIIPLSAFTRVNTDYLLRYLVSQEYPKNVIELSQKSFKMTIIRSFDINRPGTPINDIKGAVFGGSIQSGYLAIGDVICVLPGKIEYHGDKQTYVPLVTQVMGLRSDTSPLNVALPGGFIGIETTLDPSYSKADKMVGNMIIKINSLSLEDVHRQCQIANQICVSNVTNLTDAELILGKQYLVVVHASGQMATLSNIDDNGYHFNLSEPIAIFPGDKVAILSKHIMSLEMLSYGTINHATCNDDVNVEFADDVLEFLSDLPIKDRIDDINLVNDLEIIPEFETYSDQLYDLDLLTQNIHFEKKTFRLNCPPVEIDKNTTSFTITNSSVLMSEFTTDYDIVIKLAQDFGNYIKIFYKDDLKNASINVTGEHITFNNVRRTNRKFFANEFNKLFSEFITEKLTCRTCNTIGSIHLEKKRHKCRCCNAVLMTKDTKSVELI
jgi:translation initiation factor 2 subunit 3